MSHLEWTDVVPTETGDYYFYGDSVFSKDNENFSPNLSILKVQKIQNGVSYVVDGNFFYPNKKDSWTGKFKKVNMELPEL